MANPKTTHKRERSGNRTGKSENTWLMENINQLREELIRTEDKLDKRIEKSEERLNERLNISDNHLSEKFGELGGRFKQGLEGIEKRLNDGLENIRKEIRGEYKDFNIRLRQMERYFFMALGAIALGVLLLRIPSCNIAPQAPSVPRPPTSPHASPAP